MLVRAGQTEGCVDLARLAGLKPAAVICEIMRDDGEMMRRAELEEFCAQHDLKMCTIADLISYRLKREQFVKRIESVTLPTRWGDFTLHAYQSAVDPQPHLALVQGRHRRPRRRTARPIPHDEPVLVRVHSECLTGDVFGSGRCDCGDQLDDRHADDRARPAKACCSTSARKAAASAWPTSCTPTRCRRRASTRSRPTSQLGLPVDKRDYGIGSQILRDLGLRKLRIMTNNPKKIYGIEGYGLHVVEEVPHPHRRRGSTTAKYLETKKAKLGHKL